MAYAIDGLRRRPGRTALAGLGIGLATALVIALLALSAGIQASSSRLAVASGVDLLATSANTNLLQGSFPPVPNAHSTPAAFGRADPNVEEASPWLVSDLVFGNASLYAAANASPRGGAVPPSWALTGAGSVGWIPSDNAHLDTPTMLAGPGFTVPGDPHWANGTYRGPSTHAIVLDQGLAGVLHVGVGSTVWASPRPIPSPAGLSGWYANASAFEVVGLSGPFWLLPSALLSFLYLSELQSLDGGPATQDDYASLVLIHLADPTVASTDQSELERAFPTLTVLTLGDILGAINSVVNLYRTFGELVGAIGVAVATLFTSTILLMSVDDRSREIALLRAIGHTRAAIARFVLEESALLALLGLAIGIPVGLGLAEGLDLVLLRLVAGLPAGFSFVSFDAGVAASSIAEIAGIALAAAVVPAARAVTRPIAEELRAP